MFHDSPPTGRRAIRLWWKADPPPEESFMIHGPCFTQMTLLIKNVQVVGSDQKLPAKLDVFVSGDKITALGRFPGKTADKIIDGQGAYLSAGFIDLHTESDHYLSLFSNPSQVDFLKQGITTIIGGLCGASLAPLIYGSLESLEEWTDTREINVDWHSVQEFLRLMDKKPLGVNFGTLIGHSTIRGALIGKPPRTLTKNELNVFGETLKRALGEGGFGLSTGLGYAQTKDTPYAELKALTTIVKNLGGIYSTHLRNDSDNLLDSIEETIKLTKETGIKTIVSHLIPTENHEVAYEKTLENINSLDEKTDLHFSVYPSNTRILKLYTFLPGWAQKDNLKVMNLSLEDEWLRSKILKDLPEVKPSDFLVAQAPGNDSLVGYTLTEIKKLYSLKSYKESLLKLMISTKLQATIYYQNINRDLIKKALKSNRSLVVSNAASIAPNNRIKILKPDRAVSAFPKFLSLVEEENILDLETAVKKITSTPAEILGLIGRGAVKEGYFADLVGFRDNRVNFVVVNGQVAIEDGEYTGLRLGKILRHKT
ncbi:MAG: hypothetical protein AAB594_01105 [Patescibacteria group bacterium]